MAIEKQRAETGAGPSYAAGFRCIGPECEDMCCRDWAIPVDRATYRKYQQMPAAGLGTRVAQYVSINATPGAPESHFARILPTSSGLCAFFDADRLCAVQKACGPTGLPSTCSVYPRILNRVGETLEGSLFLSCPEATRNVLLDEHFIETAHDMDAGEFRRDAALRLASDEQSAADKLLPHFSAVRDLLVCMVRDRSRPMWQRLLLIGSLCKTLDDLVTAGQEENAAEVIQLHRDALDDEALGQSLESIAAQPAVRLSVILRLTDARVQDPECGARFRDVFWWFVEGIGDTSGAGSASDLSRFTEAEALYYRPFNTSFPFVMENYLLNYIYGHLFPFGRGSSMDPQARGIFEEYVLMASQFAWIEVLLIGVAGCYKEQFSASHVVKVVQSFSRATQHNPLVLRSLTELMTHLQLNSLEGMAILLRS